MIAGAAFWLTAPTDPPWWIDPLVFALGTAAAIALAARTSDRADGWAMTARHVLGGLCALVAATGLGFTSAHVRGLTVAQPAYIGGNEPVRVEGWVVANDASDNGPRLRLLVRNE